MNQRDKHEIIILLLSAALAFFAIVGDQQHRTIMEQRIQIESLQTATETMTRENKEEERERQENAELAAKSPIAYAYDNK